MNTLQPKEVLTVAETARILRVSNEVVYQLIHSRRLRAIRPGHLFRISRQALDEYLRQGLDA